MATTTANRHSLPDFKWIGSAKIGRGRIDQVDKNREGPEFTRAAEAIENSRALQRPRGQPVAARNDDPKESPEESRSRWVFPMACDDHFVRETRAPRSVILRRRNAIHVFESHS